MKNSNLLEEIENLKLKYKNYNPLGVTFKTDDEFYLYDTGTSKIMNCNNIEFEILNNLLSGNKNNLSELLHKYNEDELKYAIKNISKAIESEDILKAGKNGEFKSPGHLDDLENMLDNSVRQITLEMTEQCNLRCSYCIYNEFYDQKRSFGNCEMSEEIAKKAIDYAIEHGM